jgi:hypothetical protein
MMGTRARSKRPQQTPRLASVTKMPSPARRSGTRFKSLASAVSSRSAGERDVLVLLRRRLAVRLDDDSVPIHAMAALVKQFRDVDAQVRAIDVRAAEEAAADEPEPDDGDDAAAWDPTKI